MRAPETVVNHPITTQYQYSTRLEKTDNTDQRNTMVFFGVS